MNDLRNTIRDGVNLIVLPQSTNKQTSQHFNTEAPTWADSETSLHIIDFKEVVELRQDIFRSLVQFKATLEKSNKKISLINVSDENKERMEKFGVLHMFDIHKNIKTSYESANLNYSAPKLNVSFINPFIDATERTLGTQCMTPIERHGLKLKSSAIKLEQGIAGTLAIQEANFSGTLSLFFPEPVLLGLYKNMLDEEHDTINPEVESTASEILNIIFGAAKAILNETLSYNIKKAIPTILSGDDINQIRDEIRPTVIIPFKSEFGFLTLFITLD